MTTVAYRDGVMAGDTMTSSGGTLIATRSKVHVIGGHLVGTAGEAAMALMFLEWFAINHTPGRRRQARPPHWPTGDRFEAVTVGADRVVTHWSDRLHPIVLSARFHAIGSGLQLAFGAMAAGATAAQAVKIAMQFDPFTAGEIETIAL